MLTPRTRSLADSQPMPDSALSPALAPASGPFRSPLPPVCRLFLAALVGCLAALLVTDRPAMAQSTDASSPDDAASSADAPVAIVIHGGAGTIRRADMSAEQDSMYRAALSRALSAGHDVLTDGGTAVGAVVAAITTMEDDALLTRPKERSSPARTPSSSTPRSWTAGRVRRGR